MRPHSTHKILPIDCSDSTKTFSCETYPIDWPILLASSTVAVKEVLSGKHLLSRVLVLDVVVPPVVVVHFLVREDCLQSAPDAVCAHVRSGGGDRSVGNLELHVQEKKT